MSLHADPNFKKDWKCPLCPKVYRTKNLLTRHHLRHFDPEFKCPKCEKLFHTPYTLKQHIVFVHEEKTRFVCPVCNHASPSNAELQLHITRKHTKEYRLSCDLCGKGFAKKYSLDLHRRSVHEGVEHVCAQCGKIFRYRNGLLAHQKTHQGTEKKEGEPCPVCGKKIVFLKDHMRKVHNESREVICEICGKKCCNGDYLKQHIKRRHTKERPVMCEFCGKGFVKKDELNLHVRRTHKQQEKKEMDKPFHCDICGNGFMREWYLKIHLQNHTDDKAYSCRHCQETFANKAHLNKHKCKSLEQVFSQ